jgi:hypothetical protein
LVMDWAQGTGWETRTAKGGWGWGRVTGWAQGLVMGWAQGRVMG